MSDLHDEIQNLSAVLETLHPGVHAAQQPVLRLVSDHLRLLAACSTSATPLRRLPRCRAPGRGGVPPLACSAPEVAHVRQ